jgi:hypothetical protein
MHEDRLIHLQSRSGQIQIMLQKMIVEKKCGSRHKKGGYPMQYRWKTKVDVNETIVVTINVLDKNPDLP